MFQMRRTESVCIFIFIIGFGHIYGYAEISSDNEIYIQLSTYCIQATGKTYIEFFVKSSEDAHVALMTNDLSTPRDDWSQFFEIAIGTYSNTRSCIRALKVECVYTEYHGVLNSTEYVQLWISWDNKNIQLGIGSIIDGVTVVSHPLTIPYDVNYLAVMTHYTSSWRFYEDTDCEAEEFNNTYIVTNDTRCNGVTNYACASGFNLTSGNLTRVCKIGQQWIGDPPVCSAIPLCPEILSTPSVIVLSQNIEIGGILLMTCAKHHALVVGNLLRTCLPNATWDGVEPVCEAISLCPEILSTPSVVVLSQNIEIGGILLMTCAKHHALVVGDLFRTCLPNATWDGVEPVCEGCLFPSAALGYQFNSTEELITRMEEMKKELKVEREKTNAFIRSKISVKDNRTSSTGIGFVLGWGIIGSLLIAICLCDAAPMLRHIRHGV